MNITLEEQIEYMRSKFDMLDAGYRHAFYTNERFKCAAILATLEACREQKIAFMDADGNITGYVKVKNPTVGEWEAPVEVK